MTEFLEGVEALFQDESFSGNNSSGGELFLFEAVEDLVAFLLVLIGEEESAVALEILNMFQCTYVIWYV